MNAPANRRGFLRGLTTLPLIGGSVALIGSPKGVAGAPSEACLHSYLAWLHYEQRAVHDHLWPGYRQASGMGYVPLDNAGANFHFAALQGNSDWPRIGMEAAARAPVVLAAVGCHWWEGDL